MAYTATAMEMSRITGSTAEVEEFLRAWNDSSDFVTAFTSGSTGTPKEIRLSKRDMIMSAKATNAYFGIDAESELALPLSASYIAGKMMIVRSIVAGCRLYVAEPTLDPLKALPDDVRFSLIPIVPAQIPALAASNRVIERVACIIVGGAPTTPAQEEMLLALGIPAYSTYGMTETCSHVALKKIGEGDVFHGLPGINFATDGRGCLIIDAPSFGFGRIITNDCVELLDSTSFRLFGRADNVIISGGIKIHPEILEKTLSPLFGDRAFYITSRHSKKWGSEVILYVEGQGFDKEAFRREALRLVDRKSMPKEVIEIANFERTSSGKIIRR